MTAWVVRIIAAIEAAFWTVRVELSVFNCMTTWLPRRRTSTNPLLASMPHTSRLESLRSLANLKVEVSDVDLTVETLVDL